MLHDTIRTLRKERGFTQAEFAARLHVVRQTVSKWEKGYSVPDAQTLRQMAQVLEVEVSQLLDDNPTETEPSSDAVARQLASIRDQLAIKNNRARRLWKAVAIALLVLLIAQVLLIVLYIPAARTVQGYAVVSVEAEA